MVLLLLMALSLLPTQWLMLYIIQLLPTLLPTPWPMLSTTQLLLTPLLTQSLMQLPTPLSLTPLLMPQLSMLLRLPTVRVLSLDPTPLLFPMAVPSTSSTPLTTTTDMLLRSLTKESQCTPKPSPTNQPLPPPIMPKPSNQPLPP